jgi:uncharacterized membrane protein YcaP (DUF421 family)
MLIGLQFVVTWCSVRLAWVRKFVKSEPALLLYQGRFQEDSLRRHRVTPSEVRAALRAHGIPRVEGVAAVVLETDGKFSIIEELGEGAPTALQGVGGLESVASDPEG